MNTTRYLVTGATGFPGSCITRQLFAEGRDVRILVPRGAPALERLPRFVDCVFGDVTDRESLARFFEPDGHEETIVIHCENIFSITTEFNLQIHHINVHGTRNVVEQCVEHTVKKLVYVRSTGAIPELPPPCPIAEVDSFDPDAVTGFYSMTQATASQIVMDAVIWLDSEGKFQERKDMSHAQTI